MGKITKTVQSKHKETLTPWLQEFVQTATDTPLPLLPKFLSTFPTRWPFPKGDLYHWIPLLNRFDSVLESLCDTYKLKDGPQPRDFGCDILLATTTTPQDGKPAWDKPKLAELGYGDDGDSTLIVAILKFTQLLLDHCGNRSIYASSQYLNDLLNTTDLDVVVATLGVGAELAKRYQASMKRMGGATRHLSTALLSNHYNIQLERVQQLAQPFVKTPIVKPSEPLSLSTPAGKKTPGSNAKNAASMYANDLCALAKPTSSAGETDPDARWNGWGDVRISYYPTNTASQPVERPTLPDRVNSTQPSTPTPLRRSNTATGAQTTPRQNRTTTADDSPSSPGIRSPGFGVHEHSTPGQKVIEIPQSAVVSTPIYKLLERIPADLPKDTQYEYLHRLRVAKALTGTVKSRQTVLEARLLAIKNLANIHFETAFTEKVLRQDHDEPRRFQLVYQLAELIHPSPEGTPQVPIELQATALSLLEAISAFHGKLHDVFSALNATVNHGVLLYVVRKAVASLKVDDDSEQRTGEDEWRENLLSLVSHLTMTITNTGARTPPEIVAAGLLDILMEILAIKSNRAERTHASVVAFFDALVYQLQTSFQSLLGANGLDVLTDLITHEVELAGNLIAHGQGTPANYRSQLVDYEIPFYQQQNLKWLLKFVHHLMSSAFTYGGNTDRLLRNLVDKSALLGSIREIIENVDKFGSLVWTQAVTILSDFLNNDPTSFAALSEAGLIQSFLKSLTGRDVASEPATTESSRAEGGDGGSESADGGPPTPALVENDDRPHPPTREMLEAPRAGPLARGIRPSSDAITVVPNVLNAISLNNTGLKMVVASRAFDSFFEIFESPEHVRAMAADLDIAANIGGNFDELSRHHPALRPAIANAVVDMITRVTHLGAVKATESGWGAKLLVNDVKGTEMVADASLLTNPEAAAHKAEKGKEKTEDVVQPDDNDIDMIDPDASATQAANAGAKSETTRSPYNAITPYIFAAANFLTNYIQNAQLRPAIVQLGIIEELLNMCTLPSLPYDFGDTMAARSLQGVISQLIEHAPIIGLPSLLKRTLDSVKALEPIVNASVSSSYFAPFLEADTGLPADISQKQLGELANGTALIKELLNAQSLMRTLYHCFPYSSRAQSITLHPVNVYDYYDRLIRSLGPLLRCVISQEMAANRAVPRGWRKDAASADGSGPARNGPGADIDLAVGEEEAINLPDVLAAALKSNDQPQPQSHESPSPTEQSSPRYRNYQTVRVLFHSLMPTTFPLIQSLGKALLTRRGDRSEREGYPRSQHVKMVRSLAENILVQLDVPNVEGLQNQFNYRIIMLHCVHEMLLERPYHSRHSDRHDPQIIIPVLVAFKQQGGLDKLNAMLRLFSEEICKERAEGEDSTIPRLAAMAMKKILELYSVMVNPKNIMDSMSMYNFFPRSSDRRHDPQVGAVLLVEFRMAILPVVRELWESPLAEKVSAPTLSKIIDTLKSISSGEMEGGAYKRSDKTPPPALLKYTPTEFNWQPCISNVNQLKAAGFDADLANEAVFRSNNQQGAAKEYCEAYKKGIAGSRNPIPEDNLPKDSDLNDAPPSLSDTPAPPADEPMVLDLPVDVPAGLLEDEGILGDFAREMTLPAQNSLGTSRPPSAQQDSQAATSSDTTPAQGSSTAAGVQAVHKEDLDEARSTLRTNLIDRCLDIVRAHPSSSYEVSELISAVILRPAVDDTAKQEVGETLVNALMSFAADDDLKPNGRSIAAYAHLLSLLLLDRGFFTVTVASLRDNVTEFLRFLQVPAPSTEELPPWIPFILLIFEILLSDDEQPADIRWKTPVSEDEQIQPLHWPSKDLIVKDADRHALLESLLEILPRVGKEESLSISVLRIIVILTRDRPTARLVGDKKNLQRLFVMTKQLASFGSARMSESRISTYIMTILRHIIEDEETIKQLMRSDIKVYFEHGRPANRPSDPQTYLRNLSHVALRDPRLFVDVTNEMVKLRSYTFGDGGVSGRPQQHAVVLKEQKSETARDDVAPTVRATEGLSIEDVKPSTEGEDKQMTEVSKSMPHDTKRPILENPDGVIHFLLCELLNYKEVDDKEPARDNKETKEPDTLASSATAPAESSESNRADGKDKKAKSSFKADEHPIFIYRCFLLRCLTELLQSYNRTKIEFINFKRSAPLQTNTPIKPRTSVLNYLLTDLLCAPHLEGTDSLSDKKKSATAAQAQGLLVALVAKTGEKSIDRNREKYDYEEEPDLLFVRKFVLDTILRAYKDATSSHEGFDTRYGKMLALAEVMHHMMGEKDKEISVGSRSNPDSPLERAQAQMKRLMYEKGYLGTLTSSIADIDLGFPPVKRTIKQILRVLRTLTSTAIQLSHANILPAASSLEDVEDEIASATSLSDMEDDREETPDLYRNSALGMMEPGRDMEEDYSEDSEDGAYWNPPTTYFMLTVASDDEEMYDDEYGDEMDYEDEQSLDHEEDVSEDDDDEVEGMGHIEGLPGDLGLVEVTMEEDDDDDDMDDDDDLSEEEDDEIGSEEMDAIDSRIQIVDEEGNPVADDGASGWESETDSEEEEDDEEDDDIDYEAEAQDLDEAEIHGLEDVDPRFPGLMQHLVEHDDEYEGVDDINNVNNLYLDDGEEDGTITPHSKSAVDFTNA